MMSLFPLLNRFDCRARTRLSLLTLTFLCSMGFSFSVHADTNADAGATSSIAELALHDPSPASTSIRMKLHGIEDLRSTPSQPSTLSENGMDELKIMAQARYLAKKLKTDEDSVRQFIILAWKEANRRSLTPELLIAIIKKESGFRPTVQSRYGAQGLMQVVRRWHREKLHPSESLFDPEVNIRVGAEVLEEYLAQADGDMHSALKKYSGNARGYVNSVLNESRTLARIAEQATSVQG